MEPYDVSHVWSVLLLTDETREATIGEDLKTAYLAHKRFEAGLMRDLSPEEQCAKYRLVY